MASLDVPSRPGPKPIVSSSSEVTSLALKAEAHDHDEHLHRRFFIGPMPEKVLPNPLGNAKGKTRAPTLRDLDDCSDDESHLAHIIKENAFAFFIRQGGREEDWGEDEERGARREMVRRWRESPWADIMRKRREDGRNSKRATNRWMGSSFEIGEIAGINVIQEADMTRSLLPSSMSHQSSFNGTTSVTPYLPLDAAVNQVTQTSQDPQNSPGRPSASTFTTEGQETFVTAPSEPQASTSLSHGRPETPKRDNAQPEDESPLQANSHEPISSSRSALLPPPTASPTGSPPRPNPPKRPTLKISSLLRGEGTSKKRKGKDKGKRVHYDLSPTTPASSGPPEDPAPPGEVLQRTGEEVQDTSAGAMSTSAEISDIQWGDVVMRGKSSMPVIAN